MAKLTTTTLRASSALAAVTTEYGTSYEDLKTSGAATATTSNKLTCSTGAFTTAGTYGLIAIGDIVKNTTSGKFALVTAIDSATALSLSADIFSDTNTFEIYSHHGVQIYPVPSELIAVLDVTAAGTDAGDTLDVYIDECVDGVGDQWVNIIHFTQILGNGGAKRYAAALRPAPLATANNILSSTDQTAGNALQFPLTDRYRYRAAEANTSTTDSTFTFSLKLISKE